MEYQKECTIGNHTTQILMKSPGTCTKRHDRACQRCWEKHLSNEVEMMEEGGVCIAEMDREDIVRLARKGTVERYEALLQAQGTDRTKHLQCPDRCIESRVEPAFGKSCRWQAHDPENDGRIFICAYCEKQTCVACDRPEHFDRTCAESRLSTRDEEEAASMELMGKLPVCPECGEPYEYGGGYAYFQCGRCKHRFCGECQAPWIGPRGEYEMGRLAHQEDCRFRTEGPHADHSYRRDEAETVIAAGKENARPSRRAKQKANEAIESGKARVKR